MVSGPGRRGLGRRAGTAGRDQDEGVCAWERPPGRIAGRQPCPALLSAPGYRVMFVGNEL